MADFVCKHIKHKGVVAQWCNPLILGRASGMEIRASGMEKDIMLGRVEGTRRRDGQRTRWLDVLKEFTGMSLHQLNETAMNRSEWRSFVQRIARSRKRLDGT